MLIFQTAGQLQIVSTASAVVGTDVPAPDFLILDEGDNFDQGKPELASAPDVRILADPGRCAKHVVRFLPTFFITRYWVCQVSWPAPLSSSLW